MAKRPARITDELCELTWDADLEWYEGTRPAPDGGPPYQLAISPDEDEDELDDLLDQARRQVKDLEHRLADLRADAVGEAWELWEDEWRGDRPAMSQAAFAARFQLGFVGIYADQEPELSFRVGDLFHGHDVAVQLDEEGRFEGIDL